MNPNLNREFIETQKAKISAVYGNAPVYMFEKSEVVAEEIAAAPVIEKSEGELNDEVIGQTQSGKAIYKSHAHLEHENYSSQDHLDASAVHEEAYKINPDSSHRTARFDHLQSALK